MRANMGIQPRLRLLCSRRLGHRSDPDPSNGREAVHQQTDRAGAKLRRAVELVAEFQPAGEGLLHHARIENFALEVVNGLILRAGRGQRHQASGHQA